MRQGSFYCTARQCSPLWRKFMEFSINSPALSLLMKHLVICQRLKTPNFSALHWSPRGSLVSIGQHFVATRVVHLPKSTETSLITDRTKADLITSYCSYARPAQPGPIRPRLCWACIAVKAGYAFIITRVIRLQPKRAQQLHLSLKAANKNCSRRHFNFLFLSFKENKA